MKTFDHVLTVASKEIREIVTNRGLVFSGVFFAGFLSVMNGLGLGDADVGLRAQLNNALFSTCALIAMFVGYLYAGQTYLREKQTGIAETLLCAPVSLRSIWFGKALGVMVPSWIIAILAAATITAIASRNAGQIMMPNSVLIVHLLVAVPLFILAAVALLGFAQLMLGMRENMVVNMVTIFVLFTALAGTQLIVKRAEFVTWGAVGLLVAASLALLAITAGLSRFLSRERIVRTIS